MELERNELHRLEQALMTQGRSEPPRDEPWALAEWLWFWLAVVLTLVVGLALGTALGVVLSEVQRWWEAL